jgi:hypothetical protein
MALPVGRLGKQDVLLLCVCCNGAAGTVDFWRNLSVEDYDSKFTAQVVCQEGYMLK